MTARTAPHVDVRRLRPDDDLARVVGLFDRYRQFYGHGADRRSCHEFLRARLERDQSVVLVAVDVTGQPVGFVQLYPTFSSLALSPEWILNDLYVDRAVRRRGVASLLMGHAEALAADAGATAVVLETAATNHPAAALYRARGYEPNTDFDHYTLQLL